MPRKTPNSFAAEYFMLVNNYKIALKRLEYLKRDLTKLKAESVSADVSFAAADLLEWFDAPILLDEDFKNVR